MLIRGILKEKLVKSQFRVNSYLWIVKDNNTFDNKKWICITWAEEKIKFPLSEQNEFCTEMDQSETNDEQLREYEIVPTKKVVSDAKAYSTLSVQNMDKRPIMKTKDEEEKLEVPRHYTLNDDLEDSIEDIRSLKEEATNERLIQMSETKKSVSHPKRKTLMFSQYSCSQLGDLEKKLQDTWSQICMVLAQAGKGYSEMLCERNDELIHQIIVNLKNETLDITEAVSSACSHNISMKHRK